MSRVASFFFQLQKSSSQSTQLFAHTLEGDITTFSILGISLGIYSPVSCKNIHRH